MIRRFITFILSLTLRIYFRRIEVTGTFKQRKVELVREGADPSAIADPLYYLDHDSGKYERLTPERYLEIIEGRVKL